MEYRRAQLAWMRGSLVDYATKSVRPMPLHISTSMVSLPRPPTLTEYSVLRT